MPDLLRRPLAALHRRIATCYYGRAEDAWSRGDHHDGRARALGHPRTATRR